MKSEPMNRCQCQDEGCAEHVYEGKCRNAATHRLIGSDGETLIECCEACGLDSVESLEGVRLETDLTPGELAAVPEQKSAEALEQVYAIMRSKVLTDDHRLELAMVAWADLTPDQCREFRDNTWIHGEEEPKGGM